MKVLLVTSQITYVPQNSLATFMEIIAGAKQHIAGLLILKNFSPSIFSKIVWLHIQSCPNTAMVLGKNILSLPLRKRERIFKRHGLPVLYAKTANNSHIVSWVQDNQIDLIINIRTRCIFRREILTAPRLGCINVHHGLLPEYRGVFSDLYALAEGRRAGFTLHEMTEVVDAGDVLLMEEVSESGEKDYMKYLSRCALAEGKALAKFINMVAVRKILPSGIENNCDYPFVTKTPNSAREIAKLKARGMIL